ncbi:FliM/FliN family flagellar motor switch protein [Lentilitoribacter sp. EG35]|jgi:flagellar motor switch protein FliM|uniref:FliM/FliN family flagellar motor switch protein n=1 Tax=Lentilitoribacter sp. EG35 TaxID=3234192 RepID=UPI00345FB24A
MADEDVADEVKDAVDGETSSSVDPDASTNSEPSTDANSTERSDNYELDPELLAQMIGELGNPTILKEKCHQILLPLAQVLMVLFKDKNNLTLEASAGNVVQGTRTELLQAIEGEYTYCEAEVKTWSNDIAIYCNNDLLISVVECLMGGDDPENIEIISRPLSNLEFDLSKVVFEIVNEALKATITRNPTIEHKVETPVATIPDIEDETYKEYHAVAFSLNVIFGKLTTTITIITPQSKIIKTDINTNAGRRRKSDEQSEWTEKISKQVYASDIKLQANIGLERLRLNDIGRLQVGDVLRFADEGEPTVVLQANGKDLYNCSLGKAGNRYMVRVEEPFGDEDWMSNF